MTASRIYNTTQFEPATLRQVNYAVALGCHITAIECMDKASATRYIDRLLANGATPDWNRTNNYRTSTRTGAQLVAVPADTTPEVEVTPTPSVERVPPFPLSLLGVLRTGYYAWQPDDETALRFMRYTMRKVGKLKGCHVIATQHGETFIDRFVLFPDGRWYAPESFADLYNDLVLGVIADQRGAALRYAHEKGCCGRCNKALTDEHSRWYSIGPICDKVWSDMIDETDNEIGFTYDERHNYDVSDWPLHFRNYLESLI